MRRTPLTALAALVVLLAVHRTDAAQIDVSMNLDFNDPADFSSGGNWTIVAKADERGIAGIVVRLEEASLNFDPDTGFLTPAGFEVEKSEVFGLELEMVQGDDLADPTFDVGVIGGPYPSSYTDPPKVAHLDDYPKLGSFSGGVPLATGDFDPGDIPTWISGEGNIFSNSLDVIAADVELTVRYIPIPEPTAFALFGLGLFCLPHRQR